MLPKKLLFFASILCATQIHAMQSPNISTRETNAMSDGMHDTMRDFLREKSQMVLGLKFTIDKTTSKESLTAMLHDVVDSIHTGVTAFREDPNNEIHPHDLARACTLYNDLKTDKDSVVDFINKNDLDKAQEECFKCLQKLKKQIDAAADHAPADEVSTDCCTPSCWSWPWPSGRIHP